MFLSITEKLANLIQTLYGTVYYKINSKEYWWTNTDHVFRSFIPPLQTRKICESYTGPFLIDRCLASAHQLPTLVSKQEMYLFRWQRKEKEKDDIHIRNKFFLIILDYSCREFYFASQVDVVAGGEQNCHNAHPSRGGPVYQGGP